MTLSRRHLLAAAVFGFTSGCSRSRAAPSWPRKTVYAGVEFTELFPNDADERAPLVVLVHGRGDRPDNWVDTWRTFPGRVHIALPRAFDPLGGGFSWFEFRQGMSDAEFGEEVGRSEARLWPGIAELAGPRRIIVSGFSQGGILSFAMAARHPDRIIRAFPVAGSCPGPLLPKSQAKAAPILALHGNADPVLGIKWGREAVHAFKEQGNAAELREYEGVGHTVTAEMRADLWAEIQKTLASL